MTQADLALIGVTPEQIAYVFSWGGAAVLSSWLVGYTTGLALKIISKM